MPCSVQCLTRLVQCLTRYTLQCSACAVPLALRIAMQCLRSASRAAMLVHCHPALHPQYCCDPPEDADTSSICVRMKAAAAADATNIPI